VVPPDDAADEILMQKFIRKAAKKHGVECPSNLAWNNTDCGYVYGCGGHELTFAQSGIEEAAEKPSVKSVEEKVIVGLIIVLVNSFITLGSETGETVDKRGTTSRRHPRVHTEGVEEVWR